MLNVVYEAGVPNISLVSSSTVIPPPPLPPPDEPCDYFILGEDGQWVPACGVPPVEPPPLGA